MPNYNLPPPDRRTLDECRQHCNSQCSAADWCNLCNAGIFNSQCSLSLNLATKMSSADCGGWTESTRGAACKGGGGGGGRGGDGRRCLDSRQTPSPWTAGSLLSPGQQGQDLFSPSTSCHSKIIQTLQHFPLFTCPTSLSLYFPNEIYAYG